MSPDEAFIVELTQNDVRVIAQVLHMGMVQDEGATAFKQAFHDLSLQVTGMNYDPKSHNVFMNELTAPPQSVKFDGKFYFPVV